MSTRQTFIIGAGVAGLSAALQLTLAGEKVTIFEASPFAGGRCRSFQDRELGCRIDNGSHLVLSGNVAIHDYLFLTDALPTMGGPGKPIYPFMDLESGERWTVRMNNGILPLWLLDKKRRVAGTSLKDYGTMLSMMAPSSLLHVTDCVDRTSILYRRFWEPMTVGVLNTEPEMASAAILANVLRQSFLIGGAACIPLLPKLGLSETFVDPCLAKLQVLGTRLITNHRLGSIKYSNTTTRAGKRPTVTELHFQNGTVQELGRDDQVIFALPAWVVRNLILDVKIPTEFRSIISAHYRVDDLEDPVGLAGLCGGIAEWVFVRNGVASATVSCAERYGDYPVRDMAYYIWKDIAKLYDCDPEKVPPHRIFKEKFATFAATPQQDRLRPQSYIGWSNLALAGEWTATGLPSTIEGAIRSGMKAAQTVLRWS